MLKSSFFLSLDPILKNLPAGVTKTEAQLIMNKFHEMDTDHSGNLSLEVRRERDTGRGHRDRRT